MDTNGDFRGRQSHLLADFCSAQSLLLIVTIMVLLAAVLMLASGQPLNSNWASFGAMAMFLQWIGLTSLGILCTLKPWLWRMSLAASALSSFIVIQLTTLLMTEVAFAAVTFIPALREMVPASHLVFLTRNMLISVIISGVALRYMYIQRELQRRAQAESEARIQALQARIRPHFLFNAMNTIAALTHIDADKAEQATLDLSEIFRQSLKSDLSLTTLAEEIQLTRHYLELEKLRLHERLRLNWSVEAGLDDVEIPKLTLQPLVENAVYHGIEPQTGGGEIDIRVQRHGASVEISILNPLPVDDLTQRRGNQMALTNIRERLDIAFANRASLSTNQDESHYTVTLIVPMSAA